MGIFLTFPGFLIDFGLFERLLWSHRLVVRTTGFHPVNRGSIPRGTAILPSTSGNKPELRMAGRLLDLIMKTLITAPLRYKHPQDIERELKMKRSGVDAYEIWLDAFSKAFQSPENIQKLFQKWKKLTKCRFVAVCKNSREQGSFAASDKGKVDLLLAAAPFVDYLDVGLHTDKKEIMRLRKSKKKAKLILSHHDFKKTPKATELKSIVKHAVKHGADIIKIATMVKSLADNQRLIELALELKQRRLRHIIIGMGEMGMTTRILSQKLGNELQFVALESVTAPGQLSLAQALELKNLFSSP